MSSIDSWISTPWVSTIEVETDKFIQTCPSCKVQLEAGMRISQMHEHIVENHPELTTRH